MMDNLENLTGHKFISYVDDLVDYPELNYLHDSFNNIKILFTIIICFEYLLIVWFIYLSVLNSFQVLISTGVSKKAIPNIVNIDVAPAEPKSILFSFLKS